MKVSVVPENLKFAGCYIFFLFDDFVSLQLLLEVVLSLFAVIHKIRT
jgi:hypothetical protein